MPQGRIIHTIVLCIILMRLHRPTGIWLLLWPCWWSIALASDGPFPSLFILMLFAIGSIAMRSAGCIINDIIDRKIDAQVERTRNRPLASGALSISAALWTLLILLTISCIVLYNLNINTILLSLLFFIPVIVYPLMKRFIGWPQAFLGLTFNAGAIVGWSAVTGTVEFPAVVLYMGCIFWTIGYDTIYAHQDKKDDVNAGVKSTALSLGGLSKSAIGMFYIIMFVMLFIVGLQVFPQHNMIYYGGITLGLFHLIWQVKRVDLDNPADCMKKFRSNVWFGWIILLAIMGEKMIDFY